MNYKLADICEYVSDKEIVSNLDKNNYISTENLKSNREGVEPAASLPTSVVFTSSYKRNDTLVSNIRPYFKKVWLASNAGGCSNDVLVFRAKKTISPQFLYYILSSDSFFAYVMSTSKGTKMPRGDKNSIMKYIIPSAAIPKQNEIAAILQSLDTKIAINKNINRNLEEQMSSLYRHLFIERSKCYWKTGTIADLGTVVGGGTPSKEKPEYFTQDGKAWITPKDLSLNRNKFVCHGEIDITELGFNSSSACSMPKGTVLFSSRAPIGYIAIASDEVTTNQGFKSVVPNKDIGTAFMYYFLKTNLPIIEGMASGSTFKEVSGSIMKTVPAVIPDESSLNDFNNHCNAMFAQQENLEKQNFFLRSIRDSLLPKLMSGEIDVSDIGLSH